MFSDVAILTIDPTFLRTSIPEAISSAVVSAPNPEFRGF
jgi:hypothetical protein